MNFTTILQDCKKDYKEQTKLRTGGLLSNKDDYYSAASKAFDDAFNQYARREKASYASNKNTFMQPVIDIIYDYLNNDDRSFNDCFKACCEASKEILKNSKFGLAQKFVNMFFKNLYCYDDAKNKESKFEECHLPLDKYTIQWIRSLGNKEINKGLSSINNVWSNISEELYNMIQEEVKKSLANGYNYRVSFSNDGQSNEIKLPERMLDAEFIIWDQEKLVEIRKIIDKLDDKHLKRLGVKKI